MATQTHVSGSEPVTQVGPYGGSGGSAWDDGKGFQGAKQIELCFGEDYIIGLRIAYDDNGSTFSGSRHGGQGGLQTKITFDYPNEYLVSIRGYTTPDRSLVQSLTFVTNTGTYGPYGPEDRGYLFSLSGSGKKLVGFFGRSGAFLDAFGAYLAPDPNSSPQTVGPFGNTGGTSFYDGAHEGIKQIKVAGGDFLDSITVEYVDNGASKWSVRHGGGGGQLHTITLDYPSEFPLMISGNYVKGTTKSIGSLTIQSNMRTFGPFGNGGGNYFRFPTSHSKIVGFLGRSGSLVDAIGGYTLPVSPIIAQQTIHSESVGTTDGVPWDDGSFTTVRMMQIWYTDNSIDALRVEYDTGGRSVWGETRGANTSGKLAEVRLDYPGEFIIAVTGHYSEQGTASVIQSLTIETNKRKHGPFGTETGTAFSLSIGCKIIGFHGRSGDNLISIGVHAKPIPMPSPYDFCGPFGGAKGGLFDHGIYTTVRRIELDFGSSYVDAIRIEYDLNGRSVWSRKHGGSGGNTHEVVQLDYPEEFLISVSGYTALGSGAYLKSLTFKSNKRSYGPFGEETGNPFVFPESEGMIVGFHGRCGLYIDSFGGYVVPIPVNPPIFVDVFGAPGGSLWNDGIYDGVTKIVMNSNYYSIQYIHIEYVKNGEYITSLPQHGGQDGRYPPMVIEIDYPEERLLYISGTYDLTLGTPSVTSLAFKTNKRFIQPYGRGTGTKFSTEEYKGEIVGFHGRSGTLLDAIGVQIKLSS